MKKTHTNKQPKMHQDYGQKYDSFFLFHFFQFRIHKLVKQIKSMDTRIVIICILLFLTNPVFVIMYHIGSTDQTQLAQSPQSNLNYAHNSNQPQPPPLQSDNYQTQIDSHDSKTPHSLSLIITATASHTLHADITFASFFNFCYLSSCVCHTILLESCPTFLLVRSRFKILYKY